MLNENHLRPRNRVNTEKPKEYINPRVTEQNTKGAGRLSREDVTFIKSNVDKISPEKLAKILGRKVSSILKYIQDHRLGSAYRSYREIEPKSTHEVLKELKEKPFYSILKQQLTNIEIKHFEDEWIRIIAQFNNDVLASEEMELKELIFVEILRNRESIAEKQRMDMKFDLEKELEYERQQPIKDPERIREINQILLQYRSESKEFIKIFRELCDRAEKARKALNASRQDRVKSFDRANVDFTAWLKTLDDNSQKIKAAREMEIMKLAQSKEKKRLQSNHKFANNEIAVPILNEDSVN